MKARVWQLFEVCQHEFTNFSLPCEGRFSFSFILFMSSALITFSVSCIYFYLYENDCRLHKFFLQLMFKILRF